MSHGISGQPALQQKWWQLPVALQVLWRRGAQDPTGTASCGGLQPSARQLPGGSRSGTAATCRTWTRSGLQCCSARLNCEQKCAFRACGCTRSGLQCCSRRVSCECLASVPPHHSTGTLLCVLDVVCGCTL